MSAAVLVIAAGSARAGGSEDPPGGGTAVAVTTERLQGVLDAVRVRLGIDRQVTVVLVERNPYLVSVEAPHEAGGPFAVEIEHGMTTLLAEDEIEAALAHELGHVWVFTHHPYLQTELLANQVAMRAVSRDALTRVYEKIWKRGGLKGSLIAFLGE